MNTDHIKSLIDKYWSAQTSLEEESALKSYFTSDNISEDLEPSKSYFSYLAYRSKTGHVPQMSKEELLVLASHHKVKRRLPIRQIAIAASFVLLMGFVSYMFITSSGTSSNHSEFVSSPQLAAVEAERALLYLADKFQSGQEVTSSVMHLTTLSETFYLK